MSKTINAKDLRRSLPAVVRRVRAGESFTVLYRSRPAFMVVPVGSEVAGAGDLEDEPLFRAGAVGASSDDLTSRDHDRVLYGDPEK